MYSPLFYQHFKIMGSVVAVRGFFFLMKLSQFIYNYFFFKKKKDLFIVKSKIQKLFNKWVKLIHFFIQVKIYVYTTIFIWFLLSKWNKIKICIWFLLFSNYKRSSLTVVMTHNITITWWQARRQKDILSALANQVR